MGKFQDELAKIQEVDFFQLAKQAVDSRMRIRLLALGHLRAGKLKREIISMFRISFPTLREWLVRFIAEGVAGLQDKSGKGRKRKLPTDQEEEFRKRVESLQEGREGGRVRGQDIQVLLKEQFYVDHALPSVYHVLKRCGLSWISARSKHPKSNPIIQEDFKKNLEKK